MSLVTHLTMHPPVATDIPLMNHMGVDTVPTVATENRAVMGIKMTISRMVITLGKVVANMEARKRRRRKAATVDSCWALLVVLQSVLSAAH